MAKRKRAHDDLAIVTLAPSSSTLKSILAPSTSEVLVPNIAAQAIIGRATTKQAPVEQAPIKSMPDMSITTKDSVPMKVDRRSVPRTKEQREHTAVMRTLGKCAKCKLGPGNKQCLSSHHGVTTTWSVAVEQASIGAPVKRVQGRPPGWMTNEERDRMMLMRKLGKCAKCKPGGRNKRCDPSHHDIATTEPASVEQAPIVSIPDMSTLPKDDVPFKRSTRGPITKESRERMALMRKLGKCAKCKPGNKPCRPGHHDVSTTKSAAAEQALVPTVHTYAQSWRRAKTVAMSEEQKEERREKEATYARNRRALLKPPKSPEPVKHALAHPELFSKYCKKHAQQLARQADWLEDQKEEDLERLREVRRERVAGWDDARREEENRKLREQAHKRRAGWDEQRREEELEKERNERQRRRIRKALQDIGHSTSTHDDARRKAEIGLDLDSLGEALRRQWNGDGVSDQVTSLLENIASGKVPESMLVTLDIEFWLPSRKVFEVGMTTVHSRKVLMNTRIKHDCSDEDLLRPATQRMQPPTPKEIAFGYCAMRAIYGTDRNHCTGLQNVHEVALQLRKAGVTPKTVFLSWHTSPTDLVLLRELLASGGYDTILPSNENCILLIPEYRKGLPKNSSGKVFPAGLEVLFSILFADHDLASRNHRALADAQQLRLMVLLWVELHKPPPLRRLSQFPQSTQDWLISGQAPRTFLQKWLGSGISKGAISYHVALPAWTKDGSMVRRH